MRIKKLLIGLLVSGFVLSCTGCSDKVVNDKGEKVQSFGQFIEIKETDFLDNGCICSQYFVYDKTTKIVYVLQNSRYFSGIAPYYVLDENGEPEIAIYGENYKG